MSIHSKQCGKNYKPKKNLRPVKYLLFFLTFTRKEVIFKLIIQGETGLAAVMVYSLLYCSLSSNDHNS
jgi:hypothetical protein